MFITHYSIVINKYNTHSYFIFVLNFDNVLFIIIHTHNSHYSFEISLFMFNYHVKSLIMIIILAKWFVTLTHLSYSIPNSPPKIFPLSLGFSGKVGHNF